MEGRLLGLEHVEDSSKPQAFGPQRIVLVLELEASAVQSLRVERHKSSSDILDVDALLVHVCLRTNRQLRLSDWLATEAAVARTVDDARIRNANAEGHCCKANQRKRQYRVEQYVHR